MDIIFFMKYNFGGCHVNRGVAPLHLWVYTGLRGIGVLCIDHPTGKYKLCLCFLCVRKLDVYYDVLCTMLQFLFETNHNPWKFYIRRIFCRDISSRTHFKIKIISSTDSIWGWDMSFSIGDHMEYMTNDAAVILGRLASDQYHWFTANFG